MIDQQRLYDALTLTKVRSWANRHKPQKVAGYANEPENHPIAFYLAETFHTDISVYEDVVNLYVQDFPTPLWVVSLTRRLHALPPSKEVITYGDLLRILDDAEHQEGDRP
ncbi:MAG: hypothetical protein ACFB50_15665 [Rubrobacteraceae bacterium]